MDITEHRTPGRPPIADGGTRRINVTLDAKTVMEAKRLGDGNLSAGLRLAVALSAKDSCGHPGKLTPALHQMLRNVVRQREDELLGAPKFEAAQYDNGPHTSLNDSNEQGEA